ncbi:amyloid-beta precursor protein-like isoform X2 [Spea bombifrons]|uniref:amyloid-beta precursor protein-like isoform X2 n=1 Tax=Spea bombifrons TaxID=233779 RepID=UPI00234B4DC7|nr:amyloid-beta precursor protein-like isoform X2 [Spea bombifrons]
MFIYAPVMTLIAALHMTHNIHTMIHMKVPDYLSELCVMSLHLLGTFSNYPSPPSYSSISRPVPVPALKFSQTDEEEGRQLKVVVNTNDPDYEHVYSVEDYTEGMDEGGTESTLLSDDTTVETASDVKKRRKRQAPELDICHLPMLEGDCHKYTLKWYYNHLVGECRPFVYSGCGGNLNRFDEMELCTLKCVHRKEGTLQQDGS